MYVFRRLCSVTRPGSSARAAGPRTARATTASCNGAPALRPWNSRAFRSNVWIGPVAEARRIWDYRVVYGAEALPSVEAVEVAERMGLAPSDWTPT